MRKLRLGRLVDTLPERLALATTHDLTHIELLEQLFSDEVIRRDGDSAGRRARAARLDASFDQEMRKLIGVELLVIDDFALTTLDATAAADIYELVVEQHRTASTILTSNRDPSEWLAVMADPLLAQSAVDRLKSAAWELIIEGESYRQHEKPSISTAPADLPPARSRQPRA